LGDDRKGCRESLETGIPCGFDFAFDFDLDFDFGWWSGVVVPDLDLLLSEG
jgi:hypothetical protein